MDLGSNTLATFVCRLSNWNETGEGWKPARGEVQVLVAVRSSARRRGSEPWDESPLTGSQGVRGMQPLSPTPKILF